MKTEKIDCIWKYILAMNLNIVIFCRDGEEWLKYRQILNKIMLKDFNENFIKSYNIVINDLLNEWEKYDGQVVTNLIDDLYKISISCKLCISFVYPSTCLYL